MNSEYVARMGSIKGNQRRVRQILSSLSEEQKRNLKMEAGILFLLLRQALEEQPSTVNTLAGYDNIPSAVNSNTTIIPITTTQDSDIIVMDEDPQNTETQPLVCDLSTQTEEPAGDSEILTMNLLEELRNESFHSINNDTRILLDEETDYEDLIREINTQQFSGIVTCAKELQSSIINNNQYSTVLIGD